MRPAVHRRFHDYFLARDGRPGLARELSLLERNQRRSPEDLAALQLQLLRRLLVHARDHTRFYRERFAACGFEPEGLASLDDLRVVPPLTKHDILARLDDLTDERLGPDRWHSAVSGGTTGHALRFRRDNACIAVKEAAIVRFERWIGWDHGQWIGLVWPAVIDHPRRSTPKSRLRNWLSVRTCLLPVVGDRPEDVRRFIAELARREATILRAFPNALVPVAERVRDEGLPRPPLKAVLSMGEILQPAARALFEDVFGCRVIDAYRSRETGPMAQQCLRCEGLHVAADLVVVEEDRERAVAGGEGGRAVSPLLVTDLWNYGMPFIRYEIGDLGRLDSAPCPCGNPLPVLRDLGGRIMDVLYTTDGRPMVCINLIPNFIEACGVTNQFQIVQDSLREITLRLGPPPISDATAAALRERARTVFGEDVVLCIDPVDEIPRLASGKYRLMVCNIGDRPPTDPAARAPRGMTT